MRVTSTRWNLVIHNWNLKIHSTGKTEQRKVRHKIFGEGTVIDIKDGFLIVNFLKEGKKQLNYQICMDKGLIEFIV